MHRPEEEINIDEKMVANNYTDPNKAGIHSKEGSTEDEILPVENSIEEEFKCEFCPMKFKKRLANANHVNIVHDKSLVRMQLKSVVSTVA